jgi:hypothetical protein
MWRMTRTVLGLLALALVLPLTLSACGTGDDPDPGADGTTEAGARDAAAFKQEMDGFAADALPALQSSVKGTWKGFEAHFYSQGGDFGLWQYTAAGAVQRPPGTREEVLDRAAAVLTEQGMEVDVTTERARGTRGNLSVLVQPTLDADVETVSGLDVTFSSIEPLDSEGDYAEDAPTTPYLG